MSCQEPNNSKRYLMVITLFSIAVSFGFIFIFNQKSISGASSNISGNSWVVTEGETKQIIWNVTWKAGETHELKYQFDAPDVSPYLYLLGPLEFYEY